MMKPEISDLSNFDSCINKTEFSKAIDESFLNFFNESKIEHRQQSVNEFCFCQMSREGGSGDSSDKNSPTLNATCGGNGLLAGSNSTCIGTDNLKESKTMATSALMGKFLQTKTDN